MKKAILAIIIVAVLTIAGVTASTAFHPAKDFAGDPPTG